MHGLYGKSGVRLQDVTQKKISEVLRVLLGHHVTVRILIHAYD